MQIVEEENNKFASPIGKLIHIRKWSNGLKTKYICFVEAPDKRRKNLDVVKKQLSDTDAKSIIGTVRKSLELETKIKSLRK